MTRTIFGLLWILSTGCAVRDVDSGVERALFSWIDGQRDKDNMILLAEYIQAWTSFDTDGDSYLLKEEARAAVEQLEAGSNSYLEDMFGNQRFGFFEQQFKQIDNNNDGAVSLPEFEAYYNKFVPILDALDLFKNNIRKPPIIFSKRS